MNNLQPHKPNRDHHRKGFIMQTWPKKVIFGSMTVCLIIIPNLHLNAAESATNANPAVSLTQKPKGVEP